MKAFMKKNIFVAFLVSAIIAFSVSFAFADSWITIGTGDIGGGSGSAPSVTAVSPNSGVSTLETSVTISGTEFVGVTAVKIGTWPVSSYTVVNSTTITAIIPSGLPIGTYHVTVTNPYGTSAQTTADLFTIKPGNGDIIIDNYEENYRTDVRGQMDYYFSSGSQAGETTIADPANSTTNIYEGLKSMELMYPGSTTGQWGGFWGGGLSTPSTDAIDISSANMLVYYVKGDGTGNTERLSVTEYKDGTNDEPYRALDSYGLNNTTSFKEIKVPYTRLWRDEYSGSVQDDNIFSSKVKNYTFVYTGTSAATSNNNIDLLKAVNWTGPIIDLLGPSFGPVGITVEVIGRNFGATQGTSTISLNGLISPVVSWSANRIVMIVPSGATSGPVEVTVGGFVSNGVPFTVTTPNPVGPMIIAITPNVGPAGTTAVITGTNFLADPGAANRSTASYHITFGLNRVTAANVLTWSDTSITVIVPNIANGVYPVQVRANDKESNFVDFTVGDPNDYLPTITNVSPNSGVNTSETSVAITGTHFTGVTAVNIGTWPVSSYTVVSSTSITAIIPSGLVVGTYHITATNHYGTSAQTSADQFTVTNGGSADTQPPTSVFGNSMVKSGSNLTLGWTPATDNVGVVGYYIYRSANPIFTPSLANRVGSSPVNSYTDIGALSSTESYYYKVKAFDAAGNESVAASNIGYKLNKDMQFNTGKSNIYWMSIPNISPYRKAADIAVDTPNAILVSRLNPSTQQFEDYFKIASGAWIGNNFNVTTGESYSVVIEANSSAKLVGWHTPYTINMTLNIGRSNINWVSIPYNSTYSKASDLAASIPNAILISKLNPSTQQFDDYFKIASGAWIGNNFNLVPGEGYSVVIDANSSWTPLVNP